VRLVEAESVHHGRQPASIAVVVNGQAHVGAHGTLADDVDRMDPIRRQPMVPEQALGPTTFRPVKPRGRRGRHQEVLMLLRLAPKKF